MIWAQQARMVCLPQQCKLTTCSEDGLFLVWARKCTHVTTPVSKLYQVLYVCKTYEKSVLKG